SPTGHSPENPQSKPAQSPGRSASACSMLATTSRCNPGSPVFCISTVTAIRCQFSPTNFACACGKIPIPCGTLLFRIFISDYLRPPATLHLLHLQDEQSAKVRSKFL